MSFLSTIKGLYRNLLDALKLAHKICRLAERCNNEIQGSNSSQALKDASTVFLAACNTYCAAIQTFKDSLPGN